MTKPTDKPDQAPSTPVEPIDLIATKMNAWLEEQEKKRAQAEKPVSIPDDIPRFVTEYL